MQPRLAAVVADKNASVSSKDDMVRVGRVDPHRMRVQVDNISAVGKKVDDITANLVEGVTAILGDKRVLPGTVDLRGIVWRNA